MSHDPASSPSPRGQTTCPVCGSREVPCFFSSEPLPAVVNAVCRDRATATGVPRAPVEMRCCHQCGAVFNAVFDFVYLGLDATYDNTQSFSTTFSETVDATIDHMITDRGVVGRSIVEIGSGDGDFLRGLVERGAGNRGVGCDPAYIGPDPDLDGRLRFERRHFGAADEVRADIALARHVLEYATDPVAMMKLLRRVVAHSDDGRVFVECRCAEWTLKYGSLLDFWYEYHCHFAPGSLAATLTRAGFEVEDVNRDFDGQYIRIEGRRADRIERGPDDPGSIPALAERCGANAGRIRAAWTRQIERLSSRGPVALWGAAGKGTMLANLIDADAELLSCVVDLNPNKQGCFLPGTGHPIVGPDALAALGIASVIVVNPNYVGEIEDIVATLGSVVLVEGIENETLQGIA